MKAIQQVVEQFLPVQQNYRQRRIRLSFRHAKKSVSEVANRGHPLTRPRVFGEAGYLDRLMTPSLNQCSVVESHTE